MLSSWILVGLAGIVGAVPTNPAVVPSTATQFSIQTRPIPIITSASTLTTQSINSIPSAFINSTSFAALPTATNGSSTGQNLTACAIIASQVAQERAQGEDAPLVLAETAYECLMSIPFHQDAAEQLLDSLEPYLEWQSNLAWVKQPPAQYASEVQPGYDFQAALEAVKQNVSANAYKSEYTFQWDLYRAVQQVHDGHFVYIPRLLQLFTFGRQAILASLSDDYAPTNLPQIYYMPEILEAQLANSSAPVSPVRQINGQDVQEFLEDWASYGIQQDQDAQWNALFWNFAQVVQGGDGTGAGFFVGGGSAAYVYPGPSTILTFENDKVVELDNFAYVMVDFPNDISTGEDLYEQQVQRYCQSTRALFTSVSPSPSSSGLGQGSLTLDSITALTTPVVPLESGIPSAILSIPTFLSELGSGDSNQNTIVAGLGPLISGDLTDIGSVISAVGSAVSQMPVTSVESAIAARAATPLQTMSTAAGIASRNEVRRRKTGERGVNAKSSEGEEEEHGVSSQHSRQSRDTDSSQQGEGTSGFAALLALAESLTGFNLSSPFGIPGPAGESNGPLGPSSDPSGPETNAGPGGTISPSNATTPNFSNSSSTSSENTTVPNPFLTGKAGYPLPVLQNPDGISNAGYYIPESSYGDIAVLVLRDFAGTGGNSSDQDFHSVNRDFLVQAVKDGKKRLVIDLSANGGGDVNLAYDLFKQLFPDKVPGSLERWRAHEALNLLGQETSRLMAADPRGWNRMTSDAGLIEDDEKDIWDYTKDDDDQGKPFTSWAQKYGPYSSGPGPDNYTALIRTNLSDPLEWDLTGGVQITGYGPGNNSAFASPPFPPESIVMLFDGFCASTCSIFAHLMRRQAGVRTVAMGGRPSTAMMQAVGGTKGAEVKQLQVLYGDLQEVRNMINVSVMDAWSHTVLGKYTPLPLMNQTAIATMNVADAIGMNETQQQVPLQFVYEPADCRMFYTRGMAINQTNVWKAAVEAAWRGGARCIAGSLGSTPTGGQMNSTSVSSNATSGNVLDTSSPRRHACRALKRRTDSTQNSTGFTSAQIAAYKDELTGYNFRTGNVKIRGPGYSIA